MTLDRPARNVIHALERISDVTERGIGFLKENGEERFLSYAAFVILVRRCLSALLATGIRKGDEVIIRVEDPEQFLLVFWACLAGGMIPVPLSAGEQAEHSRKTRQVWQQLSHPWMIGRQQDSERSLDIDHILSAAAGATPAAFHTPEEIAYIQYSSGSTGDPKGVILTHANLCANVEAILHRSLTTAQDSILSWMPLTHDMGMICFHLSGIFAGIDQYIMPTGLFIRRPLLWIQKAADKKITQLYSPNFGLQFFLLALKRTAPPDWDLSPVRIIYNGAEQISEKICRQFTEALSPYGLRTNVMFPGYGLAEASVAVALPDPGDPLKAHVIQRDSLRPGHPVRFASYDADQPRFVEVGYPVPECEVRITFSGTILPEGSLGSIEIRGKNVTSGYYRSPEGTKELFSPDGWLKTGDLGLLLHGRLVITGRSKHMIIRNGFNYFPHDLEAILTTIPGIEPGNLVVTSCWEPATEEEKVLAFINFKNPLAQFLPLKEQIQTKLLLEAGLEIDNIIPVRKIPKTTSGKIQHFKLKEAFLSGEYDRSLDELQHLSTAAGSDDRKALIEKICKQYVPDFSWDADLIGSGLNSLRLLRLSRELEKGTGRQLSIADLYAHPTPSALLDYLQQETVVAQLLLPITPASPQPTYPVLPSQHKMWMLEQDPARKGLFNISFILHLGETVDSEKVETAFRELLQRHEVLRTRFIWDGEELRQLISVNTDIPLISWYNIADAQRREAIRREANTSFDLATDSLIRITVWQGSQREDELQLTIHHLITDGWSIALLLQEFSHLYYTPVTADLPSPLLQFKDYCCWYQEWSGSSLAQQAARHWVDTFRAGIPPMQVPFHQVTRRRSFKKRTLYTGLDTAFLREIDALATDRQWSRFTVLLTLLHSVLYRHNGQPSLVTGIEVANRAHPDTAGIAGPLINTLLVQSNFFTGMSLQELAAQLHDQLLKGMRFEAWSFDLLTELLDREQIEYASPLFNTLIIYHNFSSFFDGPLSISGKQVRAIENDKPLCDLVFELLDKGEEGGLFVHYDTGIFHEQEINILLEGFRVLSPSLVEHPQLPIGKVQLLTDQHARRLMEVGQGRHTERAVHSINDLITAAIHTYRNNIAIVCGHTRLTYQDLDKEIALWTIRMRVEYDIRPGMSVAVIARVSERSIPLMLAIWRIGGIYVPIDPTLPQDRIGYILHDSHASLVITDAGREWQFKAAPGIAAPAGNPACVIYTSGTTGYPKGILLTQDGLADYIQTFTGFFKVTEHDHIVQQAAVNFDIALEEMLPILSVGGRLVIAPGGGRDVHALLTLMTAEQVTILSTTPAVIQEINFLDTPLDSLRLLISGGDRLEPGHIDRLSGRHFELYNTYGPAEITICATYNKVNDTDESISIGQPIDNREVYILDNERQLVPWGEQGEIYIGGKGLALAYLNQPELSREKFIAHPFKAGSLLYRSGDLGRWLPDGKLEFLGRSDNQLKIRGYRIECEEISQAINRLGDCQSIVIPWKGSSGEYYLSAYVAGIASEALETLKAALPAVLPDYMIPTSFLLMDVLPRNANGKIDKHKLPRIGREDMPGPGEEAVTPTEKKLAILWKEILEVDRVGLHSDLLRLGGHSLKIVRLISRISKELHVQLSLKDVFEHTTLHSMAAYIDRSMPAGYQPIPRIGQDIHYELSRGQRRLWILDHLYPGTTAYNIVVAHRLKGWPGMDKLKKIFGSVIDRHESLRTVFTVVGDHPRQIILEPGLENVALFFADLSKAPDPEAAVVTCARQEADFHFDFFKGPLFRIHVFQCEEDSFILLFNIHHIVCDGWSIEVIMKEIMSAMRKDDQGNAQEMDRIQYKDYGVWQSRMIEGEQGDAMRRYWTAKLAGELPALSLPTDYERPAGKTFRGATLRFIIPDDCWNELLALQQQEHTSLYTVLLAAIFALLYKESGQKDLLLGTATAGRDHLDLEDQVGVYANTMPIRMVIPEDVSYRELIRLVHQYVLDTHEYREYPFDRLVEDLGIERDMSRYPLFDVLVNYDDRKVYKRYAREFDLLHLPLPQSTSKFDLTFHFEEGDQLTVGIEYALDLFREDTVKRYFVHLENLLRGVIRDQDLPLSQISLLDDAEARVMDRFNDTGWQYPLDGTLSDIFAAHARQTPDKIAAICSGQSYSYETMNDRATRLAGWLQKEYAVKPGDRVVLLLDHSMEMLVSILAVLKTGAAYVPVGIDYPDERVLFVVGDIQPALIITGRPLAPGIGGSRLFLPAFDLDKIEGTYSPVDRNLDDAAYIIYTSGSTGDPKGVVIRHFNVINLLSWLAAYMNLERPGSLLSISSYTFDISVLEYFFPWMTGGTLILSSQQERKDPATLVRMLDQYDPDIFQSTPSLLAILVKEGWKGSDKLAVISGGETLQKELAQRLASMSRVTYNMYGPTETTIYSSIYPVPVGVERIFIGKPVGNTAICILDQWMNTQPIGVTGEICISGDGLAAGYYNRPALNKERFIDHPHEPGRKLYLTGDLGRWTSDGDIEFLGRRDTQVKINGYRIECGEVEKALAKAGVEMAVVMPIEDAASGRYLAVYLQGVTEAQLAEVKERLLMMLPVYMIPTAWLLMDALPLNTNGKVDRKLLSTMKAGEDKGSQLPESLVQRVLTELWRTVLSIDDIKVDEDFFRMGGHSIAALKIINAVNGKFNTDLTIRDIFVHNTIRKMTRKLETASLAPLIPASIPLAPAAKYYPLSHSQYRLWLLNALEPDSPAYNLPAAFRLDGPLQTDLFIKAMQLLVARHEILRTTFVWSDGKPWQRILPPGECNLHLSVVDRKGQDMEMVIGELIREETEDVFDLTEAPLLRVRIVQMQEQTYLLALNIHHIICDAWSIEIMLREWSEYYTALRDDPAFTPAPLSLQYKDFAVWQHTAERQTWLQQHKSFWMDALQNASTAIDMPLDHPRPKKRSGRGNQYRVELSTAFSDRLRALAASQDASLFMTLFSLIRLLLLKYSGQQDITIATVVTGREHAELEQQVGFYVNTIPVRIPTDPNASFDAFLGMVKTRMLAIFQHQEYPLDLMISESLLSTDARRSNIFDVVVNYQPLDQQLHFSLQGMSAAVLANTHSTSKFDLIFDILEGDGIAIIVEYNTDIYKEASIVRLLDHLQQIGRQACDDALQPLHAFVLPTPEEQSMILEQFNPPGLSVPEEGTVISIFLSQAASTPHAIALVSEGERFTYHALNEASNRMSRYLIQECGVASGDRVALIADRTANSILWILSILKAGGIYVPIDGDHPASRIALILEDIDTRLVLTDRPRSFGKDLRTIEMDEVDGSAFSGRDPEILASSGDTAYMMYTSGSTGKPKGVQVSHRNIVQLVRHQDDIQLDREDRLLLTGSLSFDATTFEIWGILLNGGQLHLLPKAQLMDVPKLHKAIRKGGITTMWFTASWFNQLVDQDVSLFAPLRTLLVGGDKLSLPHIIQVKSAHEHIRIINGYGPTEATTFSTCHVITDDDLSNGIIPIGRRLAHTQIYILDEYLNLQPVGVTGEIWIGGAGLSKGYWRAEELTRQQFIDSLFRQGERLYRSGDLGCWREDGVVLFKGRADHQVKIRGYRIECGEVEYSLQQAGSLQTLVIPCEDPGGDGLYLAAYVSGIALTERAAFKNRIESRLPAYMNPSVIIYLDSFPVNSNGKIDRHLLPAPERSAADREHALLETEMQRTLSLLWEELLGIHGIGPDDHFFDLGGHSLKAIRLAGRLADQLNIQVDFRDIFAYPVLRTMAATIERAVARERHIGPAPVMEHYPLSFNQYSLWIAGQKAREQQAYNILGVYSLSGRADRGRLLRAFELLIDRHESVRTVFRIQDGEIRQCIMDRSSLPPSIFELDWRGSADRSLASGDLITRESTHSFDLSGGPLLRIHLVQLEEEELMVIIGMHHIIADGWSMDILVREIRQYYVALIEEPDFLPHPLSIQYKDFAYWQRQWAGTEAFKKTGDHWLRQFAGGIQDLDLSRIQTVNHQPVLGSGQMTIPLDPALDGMIRQYIADWHISHYIFFLASWHVLLYRLTRQKRFVIASPVADRDSDLMDQIGYYVNTLLIDAVADDGMIVKDLLRDHKNDVVASLQYREYPFSLLVERIREQHLRVSDDVFSVGFSWFAYEESSWDLPDAKVKTITSPAAFPKSKLWLSGSLLHGSLQFSLTYDPSFISEEMAGFLGRRWIKVIETFIQGPDTALGDLDIRLEEESAMEHMEKYQELSFDF